MTVLHPRRTGLFPVLQKPGDGLIYRHRTQHLLQRLQRQSAGAQQPGRRHRQVDDGGLHPHRTRPAVHDTVDLAVHVLRHVACRGGAGPPGGITAGGRHRHTGSLDDGPCHRMIRTAHTHRLKPAGSLQGNNLPPGQDHGQRPRPEPLRQTVGRLRYLPAVPLQPVRPRDVQDQGVVLGAALGLKDPAHRSGVQPVGPQAVHRLGGDAHQAAGAEQVRGGLDVLLGEALCLHPFPLPISLGRVPVFRGFHPGGACPLCSAQRPGALLRRTPFSPPVSLWGPRPA